MKQFLSTVTALAIFSSAVGFNFCPPTGPLLPPPTILPSSSDFAIGLTQALQQLANDTNLPFNASATSFSLTITTDESSIFQFHRTSPFLEGTGKAEVDSDTAYRIASVTKLFNVLSFLLQNELDMDDFVWQYIPELAGLDDYRDITLRMLASHVSGIPRDGFVFDLISRAPPEVLLSFGFPNATPPLDFALCDAPGYPPCSRAEFFRGLTSDENTWLPGATPAYSNYAFSLLGLAIQNATGKSLREVVADKITRPLNFSSITGFEVPDASEIIIPAGAAEWASLHFGHWEPTGGMFATPNDLARLLRSIMNNELLTRAQTATWLKPTAYTSSPSGGAVGMPWAVIRPANIPRASGTRTTEIFTMMGSIPFYGAYVALIPEYRIGITVNIAGLGDDPMLRMLLDLAVQHLLPTLDDLARSQAADKYVGSYGDREAGSESSSLVLALDDGPGLKVREWTSGGKSVMDAWIAISGDTVEAMDVDVRIYPIGGEDERWQVAFRGILSRNETGSIYESACNTWFDFDQFRYAGLSVDEIKFRLDEHGGVCGLEVPGLRQRLAKL